MDLSDALGGPWPNQNNQQAGGAVWPGQQPNHPQWPGQPSQPAWPGQQPGQPGQPAWPGQQQPGQPGQPAWPGQQQPGQPGQPAWPGQQQPGQPGQPVWPGQQPSHPEWSGPHPGQPSQPTWPAQPSQPCAPGWPSPGPGPAPPTAPQKSMLVPYNQTLPNGVFDKMLITINGTVKPNAKIFTVNLSRGDDIAMHLNPRFNENGKKVIVRNSMIAKKWGQEEREVKDFPFAPGRPFEMKIMCTSSEFRVAVNKAHLLEYKHRIRDLHSINSLSIMYDVTLSSVEIDRLP